jgi:hypothetical protein
MPAIQVARTDTFEQQRQKINQIGTSLFNITAGGSDLSTGNLKLGDGTRVAPSLSFVSDSSLGVYKKTLQTMEFVSDAKSIFNYDTSGITNYRNLTLQRKFIGSSGLTVTNFGSGYDAGTYQNVNLFGGTGFGATANITVTAFSGQVTNAGTNYSAGSFNNIKLIGGDGSGTRVSFIVSALLGSITTAGSGYVDFTYTNVPLTNVSGTGTGAIATISISQGLVVSVSITTNGSGYVPGDILTASNTNLGGSGSGFEYTVSSTPGVISSFGISTYGSGYTNGDILSLPSAVSGVTTFVPGSISGVSTTLSTSSPNITVTSTEAASIAIGMEVNTAQGSVGLLSGNTTVINVSGTTITLSSNPSTSGSATLTFSTPITQQYTIAVPSTANIQIGSVVTKTSGTGVLAANTVVSSISSNTAVVINNLPSLSGDAVLTFTPPYGSGSGFSYAINGLGSINTFSISSGGLGYTLNDVLSISASELVSPITYTVTWITTSKLTFTGTVNTSQILVGDNLEIANATGISSAAIQTGTPDGAGAVYTNVQQTSTTLSGSGARFTITKTSGGSASYTLTAVTNTGSGYAAGEILTISGLDLGGASPANDLTIVVGTVIQSATGVVLSKSLNGSNINFINLNLTSGSVGSGSILRKVGTTTPTFTVNTSGNAVKYYIDDGNGPDLHPSLTLYKDNTYIFDITGAAAHPFYFSIHPDGNHNKVTGVSTTLSTTSTTITVADTTGILPGMEVTVTSGDGVLVPPASNNIITVVSIDSLTSITLSSAAYTSGAAVLQFAGAVYTGSEVTRTNSAVTIKPRSTTPTLYYFCNAGIGHEDEAGVDGQEAIITIDQNNPRVFGAGFSGFVSDLEESNIITADIETGEVAAASFDGLTATLNSATITSLTSTNGTVSTLTSSTIQSGSNLQINAGTDIDITSPLLDIGGYIQISGTNGNITSSGIIKTTSSFNSNDALSITNSTISTSGSNNIILSPASGRVTKLNSNTAIIIPSGNTAERPVALAENGAIRFNTQTNQYEGYSGTTSSWSSLGGVRDLDGNTYILAELSVGSNDNTLWFYNDNINTVKFTPEYQEFVNVKKVRSVNVSAPSYTNWTSNTPITTGQYLKYRNNIYEVVSSGVTGTSGSEPTDTTGTNFTNGTATLRFFVSAVESLTFEEISELRVAPLGGTSLVVNDEITLSTNVISTKINDLLIKPNTGKKVTIDASTSLVLPVGDSNGRGAPIQGSVRFNTTISQYEGYDGTNWSSLGGVRDVDGNTYIIPELSAGSNENILYFYNNGSNTLRVTENDIQLDTIDTINSVTSNTLNLNAQLITFNSLAASIDTSSTSTFISTTKDNLDLGLSSGLANDPLLRLSDTGDIYYNLGFGSGVYNGVKIFDNELKELEIADYKISTTKVDLVRNTINTGSAILYDPALHTSAKVQIIAHNETTGDKEFIEYSVIDKGTDIFFTDFGNVKTGAELISCVFDFNASNNVRVTFTLDSAISSGNVIKVTVISNIIKR